jgi:hypothetical protein
MEKQLGLYRRLMMAHGGYIMTAFITHRGQERSLGYENKHLPYAYQIC